MRDRLYELLENNKLAKLAEILLLFILAFCIIKFLTPFAGENIVLKQLVIWFANIVMLLYVWLGIKLRKEKLSHFGITFRKLPIKENLRFFLKSLLVFSVAVFSFVLASIIMANITGIPEKADMSNYQYLQNNIFMLAITLLGTYIVSSFGEEVIYRAFLINRLLEIGLDSKMGKYATILVSAIIFGLVHYQWGAMGIIQTGFMGLALGYFYIKFEKKLWILVLAHGYMDTILMVQMYVTAN